MRLGGVLATAWAVLLGVVVLGGCPLPQPVPEVSVDGGTVTVPPRILVSTAVPPDARIVVSRTCPTTPHFVMQAQIDDTDTTEQVEARWFVDYDPTTSFGVYKDDLIPGTGDPTVTARALPPFGFDMPAPDGPNTGHVVEVVVSNGFAPPGAAVPYPNRSPADGYEIQLFRWVFQYGDTGGRCQ